MRDCKCEHRSVIFTLRSGRGLLNARAVKPLSLSRSLGNSMFSRRHTGLRDWGSYTRYKTCNLICRGAIMINARAKPFFGATLLHWSASVGLFIDRRWTFFKNGGCGLCENVLLRQFDNLRRDKDQTLTRVPVYRGTRLRVRQTIACNWAMCAVFSKQEVADSVCRAVKIHVDHEHLFYLSAH